MLGIDFEQVMRASRALKTHITKLQEKAGSKAQLFSNVSPVTVEILLHKVPIKANNKRKPLPLVKPIRNNKTTEICVFARDSKVAKQKLQEASAPNISKVIDLKKLRTHYNQYEARRTLASSYDLFLVEDTILPDVCHQLGSSFLRIRKYAIFFNLKHGSILIQIERLTPQLLSHSLSLYLPTQFEPLRLPTAPLSSTPLLIFHHARYSIAFDFHRCCI